MKEKISMNINLGTLLPKLASILPPPVIALNVVLHLINKEPFSQSEVVWSVLGILASLYFGVFCKEIK